MSGNGKLPKLYGMWKWKIQCVCGQNEGCVQGKSTDCAGLTQMTLLALFRLVSGLSMLVELTGRSVEGREKWSRWFLREGFWTEEENDEEDLEKKDVEGLWWGDFEYVDGRYPAFWRDEEILLVKKSGWASKNLRLEATAMARQGWEHVNLEKKKTDPDSALLDWYSRSRRP